MPCCLGNPLHSTALDEDLHVSEQEQTDKGKAGGKAAPKATKTSAKQRGAATKRKEPDGENEKGKGKKRRTSAGEQVNSR